MLQLKHGLRSTYECPPVSFQGMPKCEGQAHYYLRVGIPSQSVTIPPTPPPPSHPIPTCRVHDSDSVDQNHSRSVKVSLGESNQSIPDVQCLQVNVGHGRPWLADAGCNSGKWPNCDILYDVLSCVNAFTLISGFIWCHGNNKTIMEFYFHGKLKLTTFLITHLHPIVTSLPS